MDDCATQLHAAPDYELRICNDCAHSSVRIHREDRHLEMPCFFCRGTDFALYDPFWVPRKDA